MLLLGRPEFLTAASEFCFRKCADLFHLSIHQDDVIDKTNKSDSNKYPLRHKKTSYKIINVYKNIE